MGITKICIFPDCEREIRSRGLCNSHYVYAHSLVTRKKTTWASLEESGKCEPAWSDRVCPTRGWFMEAEQVDG